MGYAILPCRTDVSFTSWLLFRVTVGVTALRRLWKFGTRSSGPCNSFYCLGHFKMSMVIVSDMGGGSNAVLSRHVFHVTTESYDGAMPPPGRLSNVYLPRRRRVAVCWHIALHRRHCGSPQTRRADSPNFLIRNNLLVRQRGWLRQVGYGTVRRRGYSLQTVLISRPKWWSRLRYWRQNFVLEAQIDLVSV